MGENTICCYSGSGHCPNMVKSIAAALGHMDRGLLRSHTQKTVFMD